MNENAIDLSYLEEYTGGDKDAMNELVEIFYETFTDGLKELKDNITDGKSEGWSMAAHKLKGTASYVGADNLHHLCANAQDTITATSEERTAMYNDIKQTYENIRVALERVV